MLHPHNIAEKTKIIMEHFDTITRKKIGGKAKAMLVTSSRLHAVKYFFAVKKYIAEKNLSGINALVAFSGEVEDDDGKIYTETKLNGISEKALPEEFHGIKFNILIVAEKYQTGFDEPLLHTMFVDKKLDGIKAVQTLSRLNRTAKGKEDTFILDFVNNAEDIKAAFQPFYETSILSEGTSSDILYKLKNALDAYKIYDDSDIDAVSDLYYQSKKITDETLGRLMHLLKSPRDKFFSKNENERKNFKKSLAKFNTLYPFISQIIRNFDIELQKFYIFGDLLYKILLENKKESVEIKDILTLEYYALKQNFSGSIELKSDSVQKISSVVSKDGTSKISVKKALAKIIREINLKYGTNFTNADKVLEKILDDFKADGKAVKCAKENDANMFRKAYKYDELFENILFDNLQYDSDFENFITCHMEILKFLKESMFHYVYGNLC